MKKPHTLSGLLGVCGAILLGAGLVTACGSSGNGAHNGGSGSKGGIFTFGLPYPQTGAVAQYGEQYYNGIKLAIQQVDDQGGLKVGGGSYKVAVKTCDDQATAPGTVACGRRLVTQDHVPAVLTSTSTETFPLMAFNNANNGKFVIIASSASPKLTTQNNPLVTRYWYNTSSYMGDFTKQLRAVAQTKGFKLDSVGIMESTDEFGQAWATDFAKFFGQAGGTVTGIATYDPTATDFTSQLTTLIAKNPDAMGVANKCAIVRNIVSQARSLGFKGRFIFQLSCGPDDLEPVMKGNKEFLGALSEGSSWSLPSDGVTAFKAAYQTAYGTAPVIISGTGYAEAMWLMKSVEAAGSTTDAVKIRAAMAKTLDASSSWNLLGIRELTAAGETTAPVHVRLLDDSGKIEDIA